jgi:hypothetical protein
MEKAFPLVREIQEARCSVQKPRPQSGVALSQAVIIRPASKCGFNPPPEEQIDKENAHTGGPGPFLK